ncbi:MAG: hypothetical protein RMJ55_02785 [Roseiflexaceae bacterium]|nr:hypothetical protein [Roseiflexaceae bacterium]
MENQASYQSNCPICHRSDKTEKLSSIVRSGTDNISGTITTTSTYIDNHGRKQYDTHVTPLTATRQSELARILNPPEEPEKPSGFGCLWIPILLLLLFFTFNCLLMALATAGNIGTYNKLAGGLTEIALFAIIVFLFIASLRYLRRKDKSILERNKQIYFTEKSRWDSAMSIWSRSYYCHRDDVVFDPITRKVCQPQQIQPFIFDSTVNLS